MDVPRYTHKEGDELIGRNEQCLYAGYSDDAAIIAADNHACLDRIAELEAALAPFAAHASFYPDTIEDDFQPSNYVGTASKKSQLTLWHFRAAASAITPKGPQ